MLVIRRTNISLTRGDSAYITLSLTSGNGEPFIPSAEDVIRCQVREAPNGGKLIFNGEISRDDNVIAWHIKPEDTADIEAKDYYWDAQIEFSNGDIFTFIPFSVFKVLPEVTEEEVEEEPEEVISDGE